MNPWIHHKSNTQMCLSLYRYKHVRRNLNDIFFVILQIYILYIICINYLWKYMQHTCESPITLYQCLNMAMSPYASILCVKL